MDRISGRSINQLQMLSSGDMLAKLGSGGFTLCSAVSFEARSTYACRSLVKSGRIPRRIVLFDYDTKADPEEVDGAARQANVSLIRSALAGLYAKVEKLEKVNAYSTTILRNLSASVLSEDPSNPLLIDITCMTRVHLLAWASAIALSMSRHRDIYFCYTSPDSYGLQKGDRPGWRDTILVPIGRQRSFRREGHSRGVVLAGHDGERLSLALQELEPGSGCFVYSSTHGRPDLMQRAREANASVSDRLLSLRMPRWSEPYGDAQDGWREAVIKLSGFSELTRLLLEQIEAAARDDGPMVLFPFGPKPLSLSAAITLSGIEMVDSWAMYPIPDRYVLDYTQGAAKLYWMSFEAVQMASDESIISSIGSYHSFNKETT